MATTSTPPPPAPPPSSVFSLSFNQDHGCIACGTSLGYRVFQSDPLRELFRREFDVSGWVKPFVSTPGESSPSSSGKCSTEERKGVQNGVNVGSSQTRNTDGDGDGKRKGSEKADVTATACTNVNSNRNANARGIGEGSGSGSRNGKSNTSSSQKENPNGADGFTIVEMLYRTNMVALVAPRYSLNKVVMWDDHEGICTGELLFRSVVRAVKLRSDRIVVVLEHRICVYGISDLRLLHQIDTLSNPRGMCALSSSPDSCVLACPGQKRGEIRITHYDNKKSLFLEAHTSAIACISISLNGSIIATASTKGTLIRLFRTKDGSKIQELRRGADQADIYCISFSCTNHWLAVSSDKGTIHIFCLKEDRSIHSRNAMPSSSSHFGFPLSLPSNLTSSINNGLQLARSSFMSFSQSNTGSSLSFMKGVLPSYFSSEWSLSQFRLPEHSHALVAFGKEENSVIVLCANARLERVLLRFNTYKSFVKVSSRCLNNLGVSCSYYKCSFDPVCGGEMKLEATAKLFDAPFVI